MKWMNDRTGAIVDTESMIRSLYYTGDVNDLVMTWVKDVIETRDKDVLSDIEELGVEAVWLRDTADLIQAEASPEQHFRGWTRVYGEHWVDETNKVVWNDDIMAATADILNTENVSDLYLKWFLEVCNKEHVLEDIWNHKRSEDIEEDLDDRFAKWMVANCKEFDTTDFRSKHFVRSDKTIEELLDEGYTLEYGE